MVVVLRIVRGADSWEFDEKETAKLSKVCGLVAAEMDFHEDEGETKVLTLNFEEIDDEAFKDCFAYLRAHDFEPPVLLKTLSREVKDHYSKQADFDLETKYSAGSKLENIDKTIKLRKCASYLQIKSLTAFGDFLIGREFKFNHGDIESMKQVKQRIGITEDFTFWTQIELRKRFEFLGKKLHFGEH